MFDSTAWFWLISIAVVLGVGYVAWRRSTTAKTRIKAKIEKLKKRL